VHRLTYDGNEQAYRTRTQAIRAMAGVIQGMPLTDAERRAFKFWYTHHNYHSVALALYRGHRYELRVSVAGKRRIFAIDPPPPPPTRHPPQVPVTRQEVTA
jgi:ferric-dicitrate binding protein FerR (iron transport regulator)